MRPLELTIEGFKSYRDPHTFSFDGRTLFGIVGPTGAGKSSIVDALVFALYGKTPKVERDTKKLIHSGSEEARVHLLFEVDDSLWQVTRVIRRKGSAAVVLKREGVSSFEAAGERSVNSQVEDLIGLDFSGFCSSVVLPQGEFDRFLRATPAERSKILKGIFRFERVDALREAAKDRALKLAGELSARQSELASLPTDPGRLEELQRQLDGETRRAQAIRQALTEASEAEARRIRVEEMLVECRVRIHDVGRALKQIPEPATLEELGELEDKKNASLVGAEEKSAQAQAEMNRLKGKAAAARQQTGGQELLDKAKEIAGAQLRHSGQIDSFLQSREELRGALDQTQTLVIERTAAVEAAGQALSEAQARLESSRHRHAAHLLQKALVKGDQCPVCRQTVAKLPKKGRVTDIKDAETKFQTAYRRAEAASKALNEASRRQALAVDRDENLSAALASARKELTKVESALNSLLGEGVKALEEIERREKLLQDIDKAFEAARDYWARSIEAARFAEKECAAVAQERRRHAATLIEVCGFLRIDPPQFEADGVELLAAAKLAAEAGTLLLEREQDSRSQLSKEAEAATDIVERFRAQFHLPKGAPITQALEESNASIGSIRQEIKGVQKAVERATQITSEIESLDKKREIFDRLSADLTDARFSAYLLEGHRRLLAQLGSEKLYELTGRYRFDADGDFQIIDARTTTKRTSDTLSGGESFLASLALALALAEAVTQEGGRLDCFFLDEGFGSLDSESLELALEGIETLALPRRLIGLISHVGGIQARLDDLVVLDRAEDGTTVVVQTEGPVRYPTATI